MILLSYNVGTEGLKVFVILSNTYHFHFSNTVFFYFRERERERVRAKGRGRGRVRKGISSRLPAARRSLAGLQAGFYLMTLRSDHDMSQN